MHLQIVFLLAVPVLAHCRVTAYCRHLRPSSRKRVWLGSYLAILLTTLPGTADAELRTWQYASGDGSIRGELVGCVDGKLRLRVDGTDQFRDVEPSQLALDDLQYAYRRLQLSTLHPPQPAPKTVPHTEAAKPAAQPGSHQVRIQSSALPAVTAQRIEELLTKQLADAAPWPTETETLLDVKLGVQNSSIESFRLGSHVIAITDVSLRCELTIRRRAQRREKTLHSETLQVSSAEVLNQPPEQPAPPLSREQLVDRLAQELISKLQQWRVPAAVLDTPQK